MTMMMMMMRVPQVLQPAWYNPGDSKSGEFGALHDALRASFVHTTDPRSSLGLAYRNVSFESGDGGAVVRGWLVAPPSPATPATAVVMVHGAGSDRREMLRYVRLVTQRGMAALLFDCREHGLSDGARRGITLGVREHEDVCAALRYLRDEEGIHRIGAGLAS